MKIESATYRSHIESWLIKGSKGGQNFAVSISSENADDAMRGTLAANDSVELASFLSSDPKFKEAIDSVYGQSATRPAGYMSIRKEDV